MVNIEEGQFESGMKNGYCRVIHAKDGSCEVGFFTKNIPDGKYCHFKDDITYLSKEGYYNGNDYCKEETTLEDFYNRYKESDLQQILSYQKY